MSLKSNDDQLLQTIPGPLLYGGSGPAPPTIRQATVAPSGKAIVLLAQDGVGASTNITSIASSSEVQSIQLVGTPSGNAFTLSFNGQTTAPIATTTSPPDIYLLWTFPAIVGHSYNLAVSYFVIANDYFSQYSSAGALGYEIMVDGVVVNSLIVRSNGDENLFQEGTFDDGPAFWSPVIASPITATTTTIQIRCTGTSVLSIRMSDLRVEDVTTSTITYYSVSQSANVSMDSPRLGFRGLSRSTAHSYGGHQYSIVGLRLRDWPGERGHTWRLHVGRWSSRVPFRPSRRLGRAA